MSDIVEDILMGLHEKGPNLGQVIEVGPSDLPIAGYNNIYTLLGEVLKLVDDKYLDWLTPGNQQIPFRVRINSNGTRRRVAASKARGTETQPVLLVDTPLGSSEVFVSDKLAIVEKARSETSSAVNERVYESYLAVVCALENPELKALLSLPWKWKAHSRPNDYTLYYEGSFERNGEFRTVFAAAAPRMGMPASGMVAAKMIHAFRPRYVAMIGICAGFTGRNNFGDPLVADPSWDWGSGKLEVKDGQRRFVPYPHHLPLDNYVKSKLEMLRQDMTLLRQIKDDWPADPPETELNMHIGPLASGASVIADGQTLEQIKSGQNGKIIGVEMEVYGVFAAANEAPLPQPKAFAIKSVVDFADGEKNDKYQRYASYTAAQSLRYLMTNFMD